MSEQASLNLTGATAGDICLHTPQLAEFMNESANPQRPLTTTSVLLDQAQSGDEAAVEALIERYRPALTRWAHGRLPPQHRGLVETVDLVQLTLIKTVRNVGKLHSRQKGGFFAFLRQTLLNTLRDEIRRSLRRPRGAEVDEQLAESAPSPLELVLGRERLDLYERSLAELPQEQQELLMLRLELGQSHAEIAEATGLSSPDAARMRIARAIMQLERIVHELS